MDTLPPEALPEPAQDPHSAGRLAWRMRLLERQMQLTEVTRRGIPVVAWRGPGTLDEVLRRLARRARCHGRCRDEHPTDVRADPAGPGPVRPAVAVVAGALAVLVAAARGGDAAGVAAVALLGLAALTACSPDSPAGTFLLVGSAFAWASTPETLSPWVLVAAAGMVCAHVAAQVAALGPAPSRLTAHR